VCPAVKILSGDLAEARGDGMLRRPLNGNQRSSMKSAAGLLAAAVRRTCSGVGRLS
jgi:hypothetical protein